MKVGTDGVLLGAWCPIDRLPEENSPYTILDIGTGSGLIALMLAQRTEQWKDCRIVGIDIDPNATTQAAENFALSPWKERLQSQHISLQDFAANTSAKTQRYDLIVSNPPYFQNSLKNPDKGREQARHTDSLSYQELIKNACLLLKEQGTIALILPIEARQDILELARNYGLYISKETVVHTKPTKEAKRILLALRRLNESQKESAPITESGTFYIESETSPRSDEYIALTKDFYL
ncbi:MAG: methyltransferase domain-containing protein [Paludibacteraceae bacterium]|nr:methyltransferase domain-containing protein [Paludibacteraceae bacterium]